MSHHYTQADILKPYSIKASTIIRDSGLVTDDKLYRVLQKIDRSLEELKTPQTDNARQTVLISYKSERAMKGRILVDALYTLTPSPWFVDEVKKANWRSHDLTTRANQDGKLQQHRENAKITYEVVD
jgi:hypothetical protein